LVMQPLYFMQLQVFYNVITNVNIINSVGVCFC
jgi:hypothetical protein